MLDQGSSLKGRGCREACLHPCHALVNKALCRLDVMCERTRDCCAHRGVFYCQVTPVNVDIAKVAPTYHLYKQEEVQEVINRL